MLPVNLGELGYSGTGPLGTTHTHTIRYQNIQAGDAITLFALAPSVPSGGAPEGEAVSVTDSAGNVYEKWDAWNFEAAPPVVNEGFRVALFNCFGSVREMVRDIDTITATWDNPVYDRSLYAWLYRHEGGPLYPTSINDFLINTNESDAAIYASDRVTLRTIDWTPPRDNGFMFAVIFSSKVGGTGGFGSVAGFDGFFQASGSGFAGNKQTYRVNPQTHGADAYLVASSSQPPYELDLGALPAGVFVPAFNGVGQFYTLGNNAWKGIILQGLD